MRPEHSSVFLAADPSSWLAANAWGFVLADAFPVSTGHSLIISRRLLPTWFDRASARKRATLVVGQGPVRSECRTFAAPCAV